MVSRYLYICSLLLRSAVQQVSQHRDFRFNAGVERRIYVRCEIWGVIGWQHDAGILALSILLRISASQAQVQRWDALLDEKSIVLGRCDGLGSYHVLLSERGFERRSRTLGETGVVVYRVSRFVVFDERFLLCAASQRLGLGDASDGRQHLFPHVCLIGSYGQAELRLIGNDVVFRACPDITDCYHGHLSWLDFARNDGLQSENGSGGDHDGIDGRLRRSAMPPFTVDCDPQGVGIRVVDAGSDSHLAGRKIVADMEGHAHSRFWKSREPAIVDHSLGAGNRLFGGLANQHQRAVPAWVAR